MSTLKKIVSLTLALAMLMSVSVFADFADKAEIDKDAVASVNKLAAVKILNGIEKEDGTYDFNPTGIIKRAEAAKMIYVLRNGGKDDKATNWVKETASFTDTDGHWAEGYIEYGKTYGIVNGRTTTTFDPEAPVTGVELAKMLLVAAGYKAEVEGYTGANYADAVLQRANEVGIFTGCKFAISEPAPRQWAAKMVDNTLGIAVPTYIGDYLVTGAIGTVQQPVTVSTKYLGITYSVDVIEANDSWAISGSAAEDGYMTFRTLGTKKFDVANDMVGLQVQVAVKNDGTVVGVVPTGKTIVAPLTVTRTGSSSSTYKYHVNFADKVTEVKTTEQYNAPLVYFSADATAKKTFEGTGKDLVKDLFDDCFNSNTVAFEIYAIDVDGDKKLESTDYVVVNQTLYGTTSNYSDTNKTFAVGNFTFTKDDLDKTVFVENVDDDGQIVKLTYDHKNGTTKVTLADVSVGAFTAISGSNYTIGGQNYKKSKYPINVDWLAQTNLTEIAKIYTDGKHIIKAEKFVSNELGALTNKLAMLIDGYKTQVEKKDDLGRPFVPAEYVTTYKVQVLLATGATAVFEYETKAANLKTEDLTVATLFDGENLKNTYKGGIYEYDINSTNGKIVLKTGLSAAENVKYHTNNAGNTANSVANSTGTFGMEVDYVAASKLLKNEAGQTLPIQVTDDTLVFATVTEDAETTYKVIKLNALTEDQENVILLASTDELIKTALLARVSYTVGSSSSSTPYVWATTDATVGVAADGKVYSYFNGFDLKNGKVVEYKADRKYFKDNSSDAEFVAKKTLYAITVVDGVVTVAGEASGWNTGSITAKVDGMYIIDGVLYQTSGSEKGFKDNVKVYELNGTTFTAKTTADLTVAAKDSEGDSYTNVKYVLEDGKIAYIIFTANQKGF